MKNNKYLFEKELVFGLGVTFQLENINKNCEKIGINMKELKLKEIKVSKTNEAIIVTTFAKKGIGIQYFIFKNIDYMGVIALHPSVMPHFMKVLILKSSYLLNKH